MVSAVSEASTPAADSPETASTAAAHWLAGRYFVRMPDLSDETRWVISQGRAWPVWNGLVELLHDLERRGTEQQRVAAIAGRIEHLGVAGIAAAIKMSSKATLRQLRFLERVGLIRTWQGEFTTEVDEVTGRIVRNYAKAPPKVIQLTLMDSHFRPQAGARGPRKARCETHPEPTASGCETHPRNPKARVRNALVPRERTSKEVRSSGTNRRQDASGPLGRPESPAAKAPGQQQHRPGERDASAVVEAFDTNPAIPSGIAKALGLDPADVASTPPGERREELIRRFYAKQGWAYDPSTKRIRQHDHYANLKAESQSPASSGSIDKRLLQVYVANCAKTLRMTDDEVIELGKADKEELVRRLDEAGADPETGRRRLQRPAADERAVARQRDLDRRLGILETRQATTSAVSMHDEPQEAADAFGPPDDTLVKQEAADGLREALATMSPAGRERAREAGEQIDERDDEAAEIMAVIEAKRAYEREVAEATKRDLDELQEAKERQSAMLKEFEQGVARRQRQG